ncbi:MAG TPA: SRPBCC family protein [Candidatus Dormibacteraeota bacterium]
MIVNVCPAAMTSASPDRVWSVLSKPQLFEAWQGAHFVSADPPGEVQPGQAIHLSARGLGRAWPVRIDVRDVDPHHRWIDWVARLPLGIANFQRTTLTETPEGGTLLRFN